jgi:hypothetical protein
MLDRMSPSPLEEFLAAVDTLDPEAVRAFLAPQCRFQMADGRSAEGPEAVCELLRAFLRTLRCTVHTITEQWHVDDVWIAEVQASYELRDHLQLTLPRAFIVRQGPEGITDLRAYGAHERPLTEHRTGEEGMWVGSRWIPPL